MTHHRRGLRRLLKNDALLEKLERDWTTAGLDERRHAMLAFAERLTVEPASMRVSHVDDLRSKGFTDRDILDVVEVTAYYAYVNRIADGLGVTVEPWVADEPSQRSS